MALFIGRHKEASFQVQNGPVNTDWKLTWHVGHRARACFHQNQKGRHTSVCGKSLVCLNNETRRAANQAGEQVLKKPTRTP